MVDRKARDKLAEELRHLVSGQLTNDEFDAASPDDCPDAAVTAVWKWGWGHYSSGLFFPYRLRGAYRLPRETRRTAARAVVFLHSDLEYEWPPFEGFPPPFWTFPWGAGWCLLFGLAALTLAGCAGVVGTWGEAVGVGLFAAFLLGIAAHWLLTFRPLMEQAERFYASGDIELWPFIRREDFEAARRRPRLLGGVRT